MVRAMPLINSPYPYTPTELGIVQLIYAKVGLTSADWNDPTLKDLKKTVKKFYRAAQKGKCCYCRFPLPTHPRSYDLEHIISREQAICYMLWPQNLAASCTDCNFAKGRKTVVKKGDIQKNAYPKYSEIDIVHPHLDEYDEHIAVISGLYLGLEKKGADTIAVCDLTRYHDAALRNIAGYEDEDDYIRLLEMRAKSKTNSEKAVLDSLIALHAKNRTGNLEKILAAA